MLITLEHILQFLKEADKLPPPVRTALTQSLHFNRDTGLLELNREEAQERLDGGEDYGKEEKP